MLTSDILLHIMPAEMKHAELDSNGGPTVSQVPVS